MKLPALFLAAWPVIAQFSTADLLAVRNASPADLSRDGLWLAATVSSTRDRLGVNNYRFGDPAYASLPESEGWAIQTKTGETRRIYDGKRRTGNFKWSPDAKTLAYCIREGDFYWLVLWDRETGATRRLSDVIVASGNSDLQWLPDSKTLLIPVRDSAWYAKTTELFDKQTKAPVVVMSSKDPFLTWDEIRRMGNQRGLVAYDLATNKVREILPQGRYNFEQATEDGSTLVFRRDLTKKTDYDVIFGSEDEVIARPLNGGEERKILASTKGVNLAWSGDFKRYAYAKEGKLFTGSIDDKEAKQIAGKKGDTAAPKPDEPKKDDETFAPVRLSFDGSKLVASNKQGLWFMDATTGAKEQIVKTPEDDKTAPQYATLAFSPSGDAVYLSYSSRTKYERGMVRYDVKNKNLTDLFKDPKLFRGYTLSHDGGTWIFQSAPGGRPFDLWSADAGGGNRKRLLESNPQIAKGLQTELVSYLNADGKTMHGVLSYPDGYEKGKKYPVIFSLYEQFFDDTFAADAALLNANGYTVFWPSVDFETGFPGDAWVKAVTAAANKLIEMGVADGDKLGIQGISYGGYATNLLVTQTSRFKAAINISGKVNMVSFYTDSPRLGVRNIHAPEKSQDRLGSTLWQQPQKYLAHSAILNADRIKTPLLLITGDQDHNVPARQAMEMFYALRRLGKEVEWVSYTNSGHGPPNTTEDELRDYHSRILAWYDKHLKNPKTKAEPKSATE